ncbi:hypothetical protein B0T10DRAFT_496234 [Thelonectria olida]|uniref:Uncharacterized protein n=1 Tax=Thelonectria olida TaxID=1576542 RepID=A0A9P8VUD3_9HYPO|nr:hypothetical protein B0T10DRAFT_496234 [Thelonectria olida]
MIRHPSQRDSPAAHIDSEEARSLSSQSDAAQSVVSSVNASVINSEPSGDDGPVAGALEWEEACLKLRPIICFGLKHLDEQSTSLQRDAIISIAWIQPKSIGVKQWDLGSNHECVSLCGYIKQEPFFRNLKEPKYPRVFQLDRGGICWVPKGYLGLAVPLHDKDIDITFLSYLEASSCNHTWPVSHKLYLTQTGFKAEARLKFAMVLLRLQGEQLSIIHSLSQVSRAN